MAVVLFVGTVRAGRKERKEVSFPPDDNNLLIMDFDMTAGVFEIRTDDIDNIAKADIRYDPRRIDIMAEYEKEDSIGYLDLGCEPIRKSDIDTDDSYWELTLPRKYRTEMTIKLGACQADIDLGGMPLELIEMDVGAAEVLLIFSQPNPSAAERMIFEAGAADFAIEKLGNANFKRLSFDGGIGKFEFDFSGEYHYKCRASISVGLGKAIIRIPRDLPVRIDAEESFLSSIDFKNLDHPAEVNGDYYESSDYRDAGYGLDLEIDIGLGSVELIWID
jgi:hypothetical protein